MNKSTQNARAYALQQETYVSLPFHGRITRWEGVRELLIASKREPDTCCGYAHHIGSIRDFATYRLKVRYAPRSKGILTLPGIFILDGGQFQPLSENALFAGLEKEEGRG